MKKSHLGIGLLSVMLVVLTFSCQSVGKVLEKPSLALKAIAIKSLDLEGITFNCDYTITNPYPVSFSVKQVAADVLYEGGTFTQLTTSKGLSVAARGTKTNSMLFKVPYDTILSFAKKTSGKTSLPFTLKGSASFDLSKIPLAENKSLSIPFTKAFDVPVFKPSLSVSDVKLQLPTVASLTKSLTSGGMNAVKAAALAANIVAGKGVSESDLSAINLDLDLNFNVKVANQGSSAWKFVANTCALQSATGGALASVSPTGNTAVSTTSGTIPMKATLSTTKAAAFLAQLINKKGSNPTFVLDSGISFPELKYAPNLPLKYTKEIPLSSVSR